MPYSVTYPPAPPTISGDNITVSAFLRSVPHVARVLDDLTRQRFIAERIFDRGPQATGGAVTYDQVTTSDLFTDRDVEAIRPGAEFPMLTSSAPTPKVGAVEKYGGEVRITREQRNRNRWDVVNREFTKLRNTVVRKVDAIAIAALDAAPLNTHVGVDFTTATTAQKIAALVAAIGLINNPDNGYIATAAFLNPTQADEMMADVELIKLLQPEGPSQPLRTGNVGRMLDIDFFKSNRVAAGTMYVVAGGQVGAISQEEGDGVLTDAYEDKHTQASHIQGWRPIVPFVTDPKAVTKVTGI